MRCTRQQPPRASAFTLFEILIVLALMGGMAAMAYPSLRRLQMEHQLKQGAELVRLQLVSTRLHALETGMDYQFRYEPNGKRFISVPADYQALQTQAAQNSGNSAAVNYWKALGQFQVKVTFSSSNASQAGSAGQVSQPLPEQFLAGFGNLDQLRQVAWSAPLVFRADGSASDFQVEIENDSGNYVTLEVRGITGGTNVTPILRRVRR